MGKKQGAGARTRSRELAVQAIYQWQLADTESGELANQFREQTAFQRVDQDYFLELLKQTLATHEELSEIVAEIADRPNEQLDPVENAILLIGAWELKHRIDIPYRVVINEGVNLAKRFGAAESHKYINACLDRAAQSLRKIEIEGGL